MDVEIDDWAKLSELRQWDLSKLEDEAVRSNLWLGEEREEQATRMAREYSLRRALLQDVARASMQYASSQGGTRRKFDELMQSGANLVDYLESSLTRDRWSRGIPNWDFWQHQVSPGRMIREGKCPYIERDGIISITSSYLELPYRAPRLERTLVDLLIATELFAYGDEVFTPLSNDIRRWLPAAQSPIHQRHALLSYLSGRFWDAVFLLGGAALAANLLPSLVGQTATDWVVGVAVALFFASFLFFTAILPFVWRHQARTRQKARDLLTHMTDTYAELADGGTISTRRLRELAQRAADAGVVWPSPLFALLDDNIARGGLLA